jgi:heat shock protein HslJ
MNEHDLIREARAALDDLVEAAPEAPSLKSITAGYAQLRHIEPPLTRRRPAMILLAAAAVTLLVVGIASLIGSNVGDSDGVTAPGVTATTSQGSVQGIWVLSEYIYEGSTQTVDEATLTASGRTPAWIEIDGETLTGFAGCNTIEGAVAPNQDGDVMMFDEIIMTAVGCLDETPEPAMLAALGTGSDGVAVTVDVDTMTWTTDTVQLTFARRDRSPVAGPGEWASSIGRLDCSPGVYLTQMIPVTGQPSADLLDALMAVPGVTTVEEGDPFWWGLDGGIIAGGAYGDVEPRVIQLVACAESFGVRADADLAAQTFTWANDLGLAQTSPLVWGERFIELCAADPGLVTLAQRYLTEDAATSVRGDGSLPTAEQATQTLETIQRSTCSADRPRTTTTVPPGTENGLATTTTVITSPGPFTCSTTGMEIPADYPPAYENLPDPVARTWSMLFDTALGCDFETLIAIAQDGADGEFNDAIIFWGAAGTLEGLTRYDAGNGSLRSLVLALTTLPTAPFEGQRYDAETQTAVPQDYWSWPPVHDDLGNGVGIEELWDADTLERVAAFNDMTVDELVLSINEFGGYAGFRVGIAEDGTWLFALAGD